MQVPLEAQVKFADQIVVVEFGGRFPFEGNLAVYDDVAAIGDANGLREILLSHEHGKLIVVLELLDRIEGRLSATGATRAGTATPKDAVK